MANTREHKLNLESPRMTQEDLSRYRTEREKIDSGIIASQTPPARAGFEQYVSTKEKLQKKLRLGWSHRLDSQGNQYYVEDSKGELLYVLEMPTEIYESVVQAHYNKLAAEPLEAMQSTRTFGDKESSVYGMPGSFSTGSHQYSKK